MRQIQKSIGQERKKIVGTRPIIEQRWIVVLENDILDWNNEFWNERWKLKLKKEHREEESTFSVKVGDSILNFKW